MISIVLRGGGRLSFLLGQGFTGGSDPECSYPEQVSGSKEAEAAEIAENRFRNEFGMTISPLPLADLRTDGVSESEQIRIASRLSRQEHAPQANYSGCRKSVVFLHLTGWVR
ncbi:MAG: hypothetical protein KH301_07165 [Brachyspira sp.]|nr:hypothetical protein [Brachyspira sp.]